MQKNEVKSRKFCETDDYITMEYLLKREGCRLNDSHIPIIRRLITIGRSPNCTITLKSIRVSRMQCEIIYSDENIFLRDTQSSNGTYLNNEKLTNEMRKLEIGDLIGFGVNPMPKRVYDPNQFVFSLQRFQSEQSVEIADDENADGKSMVENIDHTYNLDPVDNLTLKAANSDDFMVQYDFGFSDDEDKPERSLNVLESLNFNYEKPTRDLILNLFNDEDEASRSALPVDSQLEIKGLSADRCETVRNYSCDAVKKTESSAQNEAQDDFNGSVTKTRSFSENLGVASKNSLQTRSFSTSTPKVTRKVYNSTPNTRQGSQMLLELLQRPSKLEEIRLQQHGSNFKNIASNLSSITSKSGEISTKTGNSASKTNEIDSKSGNVALNFNNPNVATPFSSITTNVTPAISTNITQKTYINTKNVLTKSFSSESVTLKILQKQSIIEANRRKSMDFRSLTKTASDSQNPSHGYDLGSITSKVVGMPVEVKYFRRHSTEISKLFKGSTDFESTAVVNQTKSEIKPQNKKPATMKSGTNTQILPKTNHAGCLMSKSSDFYGTFEHIPESSKAVVDYYNNETDNEDESEVMNKIVTAGVNKAGRVQQIITEGTSIQNTATSAGQITEVLKSDSKKQASSSKKNNGSEDMTKGNQADTKNSTETKEPQINFDDIESRKNKAIQSVMQMAEKIKSNEHRKTQADKREVGSLEPKQTTSSEPPIESTEQPLNQLPTLDTDSEKNRSKLLQNLLLNSSVGVPSLNVQASKALGSSTQVLGSLNQEASFQKFQNEQHKPELKQYSCTDLQNKEKTHQNQHKLLPMRSQGSPCQPQNASKLQRLESQISQASQLPQPSTKPTNPSATKKTPQPVQPKILKHVKHTSKPTRIRRTEAEINRDLELCRRKLESKNNEQKNLEIGSNLIPKSDIRKFEVGPREVSLKVAQSIDKAAPKVGIATSFSVTNSAVLQQSAQDIQKPLEVSTDLTKKSKFSSTDVDEIKEILIKAVEKIKEKIIKKKDQDVAQEFEREIITKVLKIVGSSDEDESGDILDEKSGEFVKKDNKDKKVLDASDKTRDEAENKALNVNVLQSCSKLSNNPNLPDHTSASVEVQIKMSTIPTITPIITTEQIIETTSPSIPTILSKKISNVQPLPPTIPTIPTRPLSIPTNSIITTTSMSLPPNQITTVPILLGVTNVPQNNVYSTAMSFNTVYTAPVPYNLVNSTPILMESTNVSPAVANVNAVNNLGRNGTGQVGANQGSVIIATQQNLETNLTRIPGSTTQNVAGFRKGLVGYSQNLLSFPQNVAIYNQSLENLASSATSYVQSSKNVPYNSPNYAQNLANFGRNSEILTYRSPIYSFDSSKYPQDQISTSVTQTQPINPISYKILAKITPILPQTGQISSNYLHNLVQVSQTSNNYTQKETQGHHNIPSFATVPITSTASILHQILPPMPQIQQTTTHKSIIHDTAQDSSEEVTLLSLEPARRTLSIANLLETSKQIQMNRNADSDNLYATTMNEIFFPQSFVDVSSRLGSESSQGNELSSSSRGENSGIVHGEEMGKVQTKEDSTVTVVSTAATEERKEEEEARQNEDRIDYNDNVGEEIGNINDKDTNIVTESVDNQKIEASGIKIESISASQSESTTHLLPITTIFDNKASADQPLTNTQNKVEYPKKVDCEKRDDFLKNIMISNKVTINKQNVLISARPNEKLDKQAVVSSVEVEEDIQSCDETESVINSKIAMANEIGVLIEDQASSSDEKIKQSTNLVQKLDSFMSQMPTKSTIDLQTTFINSKNPSSATESVAETDLDQLEVSSFGSCNDQEESDDFQDNFKVPLPITQQKSPEPPRPSRSKSIKSNVNSKSSQLTALNSTVRRSKRKRNLTEKVIEGLAALKGLKHKVDNIKEVIANIEESEVVVPETHNKIEENEEKETSDTNLKTTKVTRQTRRSRTVSDHAVQLQVESTKNLKDEEDKNSITVKHQTESKNLVKQTQKSSKPTLRSSRLIRQADASTQSPGRFKILENTQNSQEQVKSTQNEEIKLQKSKQNPQKPSKSPKKSQEQPPKAVQLTRISLRTRSYVGSLERSTEDISIKDAPSAAKTHDETAYQDEHQTFEASLEPAGEVKSSVISTTPVQTNSSIITQKHTKTLTPEKQERRLRSAGRVAEELKDIFTKSSVMETRSKSIEQIPSFLESLLIKSLDMLSDELLENRKKSEGSQQELSSPKEASQKLPKSKSSEELTTHTNRAGTMSRSRSKSSNKGDKEDQTDENSKERTKSPKPGVSSKQQNQEKPQKHRRSSTRSSVSDTALNKSQSNIQSQTQKSQNIIKTPEQFSGADTRLNSSLNSSNVHEKSPQRYLKTRSSERLTTKSPQVATKLKSLQKTRSFELFHRHGSKISNMTQKFKSSDHIEPLELPKVQNSIFPEAVKQTASKTTKISLQKLQKSSQVSIQQPQTVNNLATSEHAPKVDNSATNQPPTTSKSTIKEHSPKIIKATNSIEKVPVTIEKFSKIQEKFKNQNILEIPLNDTAHTASNGSKSSIIVLRSRSKSVDITRDHLEANKLKNSRIFTKFDILGSNEALGKANDCDLARTNVHKSLEEPAVDKISSEQPKQKNLSSLVQLTKTDKLTALKSSKQHQQALIKEPLIVEKDAMKDQSSTETGRSLKSTKSIEKSNELTSMTEPASHKSQKDSIIRSKSVEAANQVAANDQGPIGNSSAPPENKEIEMNVRSLRNRVVGHVELPKASKPAVAKSKSTDIKETKSAVPESADQAQESTTPAKSQEAPSKINQAKATIQSQSKPSNQPNEHPREPKLALMTSGASTKRIQGKTALQAIIEPQNQSSRFMTENLKASSLTLVKAVQSKIGCSQFPDELSFKSSTQSLLHQPANPTKPSFSTVFLPSSAFIKSSIQATEETQLRRLRERPKLIQALHPSPVNPDHSKVHESLKTLKQRHQSEAQQAIATKLTQNSLKPKKIEHIKEADAVNSQRTSPQDSQEAKKQRLENSLTNKLLTINLRSLRSRAKSTDLLKNSESVKTMTNPQEHAKSLTKSQVTLSQDPPKPTLLVRRSLNPPITDNLEILKKLLIKPRKSDSLVINKPSQPVKSIREQLLESQKRSRSAEGSMVVKVEAAVGNQRIEVKKGVESKDDKDHILRKSGDLKTAEEKNEEQKMINADKIEATVQKKSEEAENIGNVHSSNTKIYKSPAKAVPSPQDTSKAVLFISTSLNRHQTRSTRISYVLEPQNEVKESKKTSPNEASPQKSIDSEEKPQISTSSPIKASKTTQKLTKVSDIQEATVKPPEPNLTYLYSADPQEFTQISQDLKDCFVTLQRLTPEEILTHTQRSRSLSISTRSNRSSMSSPERPLSRKSSTSSEHVIFKRVVELKASSSRRSSIDSVSDVVPLINLIHRPNLRSSGCEQSARSSPNKNVKESPMSSSVRTLLRQISDEKASSTENLTKSVKKNLFVDVKEQANTTKIPESSDDDCTLQKYVEKLKEGKTTPKEEDIPAQVDAPTAIERPTRSRLSRTKTTSETEVACSSMKIDTRSCAKGFPKTSEKLQKSQAASNIPLKASQSLIRSCRKNQKSQQEKDDNTSYSLVTNSSKEAESGSDPRSESADPRAESESKAESNSSLKPETEPETSSIQDKSAIIEAELELQANVLNSEEMSEAIEQALSESLQIPSYIEQQVESQLKIEKETTNAIVVNEADVVENLDSSVAIDETKTADDNQDKVAETTIYDLLKTQNSCSNQDQTVDTAKTLKEPDEPKLVQELLNSEQEPLNLESGNHDILAKNYLAYNKSQENQESNETFDATTKNQVEDHILIFDTAIEDQVDDNAVIFNVIAEEIVETSAEYECLVSQIEEQDEVSMELHHLEPSHESDKITEPQLKTDQSSLKDLPQLSVPNISIETELDPQNCESIEILCSKEPDLLSKLSTDPQEQTEECLKSDNQLTDSVTHTDPELKTSTGSQDTSHHLLSIGTQIKPLSASLRSYRIPKLKKSSSSPLLSSSVDVKDAKKSRSLRSSGSIIDDKDLSADQKSSTYRKSSSDLRKVLSNLKESEIDFHSLRSEKHQSIKKSSKSISSRSSSSSSHRSRNNSRRSSFTLEKPSDEQHLSSDSNEKPSAIHSNPLIKRRLSLHERRTSTSEGEKLQRDSADRYSSATRTRRISSSFDKSTANPSNSLMKVEAQEFLSKGVTLLCRPGDDLEEQQQKKANKESLKVITVGGYWVRGRSNKPFVSGEADIEPKEGPVESGVVQQQHSSFKEVKKDENLEKRSSNELDSKDSDLLKTSLAVSSEMDRTTEAESSPASHKTAYFESASTLASIYPKTPENSASSTLNSTNLSISSISPIQLMTDATKLMSMSQQLLDEYEKQQKSLTCIQNHLKRENSSTTRVNSPASDQLSLTKNLQDQATVQLDFNLLESTPFKISNRQDIASPFQSIKSSSRQSLKRRCSNLIGISFAHEDFGSKFEILSFAHEVSQIKKDNFGLEHETLSNRTQNLKIGVEEQELKADRSSEDKSSSLEHQINNKNLSFEGEIQQMNILICKAIEESSQETLEAETKKLSHGEDAEYKITQTSQQENSQDPKNLSDNAKENEESKKVDQFCTNLIIRVPSNLILQTQSDEHLQESSISSNLLADEANKEVSRLESAKTMEVNSSSTNLMPENSANLVLKPENDTPFKDLLTISSKRASLRIKRKNSQHREHLKSENDSKPTAVKKKSKSDAKEDTATITKSKLTEFMPKASISLETSATSLEKSNIDEFKSDAHLSPKQAITSPKKLKTIETIFNDSSSSKSAAITKPKPLKIATRSSSIENIHNLWSRLQKQLTGGQRSYSESSGLNKPAKLTLVLSAGSLKPSKSEDHLSLESLQPGTSSAVQNSSNTNNFTSIESNKSTSSENLCLKPNTHDDYSKPDAQTPAMTHAYESLNDKCTETVDEFTQKWREVDDLIKMEKKRLTKSEAVEVEIKDKEEVKNVEEAEYFNDKTETIDSVGDEGDLAVNKSSDARRNVVVLSVETVSMSPKNIDEILEKFGCEAVNVEDELAGIAENFAISGEKLITIEEQLAKIEEKVEAELSQNDENLVQTETKKSDQSENSLELVNTVSMVEDTSAQEIESVTSITEENIQTFNSLDLEPYKPLKSPGKEHKEHHINFVDQIKHPKRTNKRRLSIAQSSTEKKKKYDKKSSKTDQKLNKLPISTQISEGSATAGGNSAILSSIEVNLNVNSIELEEQQEAKKDVSLVVEELTTYSLAPCTRNSKDIGNLDEKNYNLVLDIKDVNVSKAKESSNLNCVTSKPNRGYNLRRTRNSKTDDTGANPSLNLSSSPIIITQKLKKSDDRAQTFEKIIEQSSQSTFSDGKMQEVDKTLQINLTDLQDFSDVPQKFSISADQPSITMQQTPLTTSDPSIISLETQKISTEETGPKTFNDAVLKITSQSPKASTDFEDSSKLTKSDAPVHHKHKKVAANWTAIPTGPSSIRITKTSISNFKEGEKLIKSRRRSTLPSDAPGTFKEKSKNMHRSFSLQEPIAAKDFETRYSIKTRRSSVLHDPGATTEVLVISKDQSHETTQESQENSTEPPASFKSPQPQPKHSSKVHKRTVSDYKHKGNQLFLKKPQTKPKSGIKSKVIANYTAMVRSLTKATTEHFTEELKEQEKSLIREFSTRTGEFIKSAKSIKKLVNGPNYIEAEAGNTRTDPIMTRHRSVSLDSRQVAKTGKKLRHFPNREAEWYEDCDFEGEDTEIQKLVSGPIPLIEPEEIYIEQPIQQPVQKPNNQKQPHSVQIIDIFGNTTTLDAYRQSITAKKAAAGLKKKFIFQDGSEVVMDDAGNVRKNSDPDVIIEIMDAVKEADTVIDLDEIPDDRVASSVEIDNLTGTARVDTKEKTKFVHPDGDLDHLLTDTLEVLPNLTSIVSNMQKTSKTLTNFGLSSVQHTELCSVLNLGPSPVQTKGLSSLQSPGSSPLSSPFLSSTLQSTESSYLTAPQSQDHIQTSPQPQNRFRKPQDVAISQNRDLVTHPILGPAADLQKLLNKQSSSLNDYYQRQGRVVTQTVTSQMVAEVPKDQQQVGKSSKPLGREFLMQKLKKKLKKMHKIKQINEQVKQRGQLSHSHPQDSSDDSEYDNLPELQEIQDCLNDDELEFILHYRLKNQVNAQENPLSCDKIIDKLEGLLTKISASEKNLQSVSHNQQASTSKDSVQLADPLPSVLGFTNLQEVLQTLLVNLDKKDTKKLQDRSNQTSPQQPPNKIVIHPTHNQPKVKKLRPKESLVRIFRVTDVANPIEHPEVDQTIAKQHIIIVPTTQATNVSQFRPVPVTTSTKPTNVNQRVIQQPVPPQDSKLNSPVEETSHSKRSYTFIDHEDEVLIIENNPPQIITSDQVQKILDKNNSASDTPNVRNQKSPAQSSVPKVNEAIRSQQSIPKPSEVFQSGFMSQNLQQLSLNPQLFGKDLQQEIQRDDRGPMAYHGIQVTTFTGQQTIQYVPVIQSASSAIVTQGKTQNPQNVSHQHLTVTQIPITTATMPQYVVQSPQGIQYVSQEYVTAIQQYLELSQRPQVQVNSSQESQIVSQRTQRVNFSPQIQNFQYQSQGPHQHAQGNQIPPQSVQKNPIRRQSVENSAPRSNTDHARGLLVLSSETLNQRVDLMNRNAQNQGKSPVSSPSIALRHDRQLSIGNSQAFHPSTSQYSFPLGSRINKQIAIHTIDPLSSKAIKPTILGHESQLSGKNPQNTEISSLKPNHPIANSHEILSVVPSIHPAASKTIKTHQLSTLAQQNLITPSHKTQLTLQPPDSMSFSQSLRAIANKVQDKNILDLASLIDKQGEEVIVLDDSLEDETSTRVSDSIPALVPLEEIMSAQGEPIISGKKPSKRGRPRKVKEPHKDFLHAKEQERLAMTTNDQINLEENFLLKELRTPEPARNFPVVNVDLSAVVNDVKVIFKTIPQKKRRGRPPKIKIGAEASTPKVKRGRKTTNKNAGIGQIPESLPYIEANLQQVALSDPPVNRKRMDSLEIVYQRACQQQPHQSTLKENIKNEAEVVLQFNLLDENEMHQTLEEVTIETTKPEQTKHQDHRSEAGCLAETDHLSEKDAEEISFEEVVTTDFKSIIQSKLTIDKQVDSSAQDHFLDISTTFEPTENQQIRQAAPKSGEDLLTVSITASTSNKTARLQDQFNQADEFANIGQNFQKALFEDPDISSKQDHLEDVDQSSRRDQFMVHKSSSKIFGGQSSKFDRFEDQNSIAGHFKVNGSKAGRCESISNEEAQFEVLSSSAEQSYSSDHQTSFQSTSSVQFQDLEDDNLSESEDITPFYPKFPEATVILRRLTDEEIALAMSSIKRLESSSIYENFASTYSEILDSKGISEKRSIDSMKRKRSASCDEEDWVPKVPQIAVKSAFSSSAIKTAENSPQNERKIVSSSEDSDGPSVSPAIKRHRIGLELYYEDPDYLPAGTSKKKQEHHVVRPSDLDKFCHRDSDDDEEDEDDDMENYGSDAYGTRIPTVSTMSPRQYKNYLSTIRTNESAESSSQVFIELSDEEAEIDAYSMSDDERIMKMPIVNKNDLIPKEKSILAKKGSKNGSRKVSFYNSVFVRTFLSEDE